MNSLSLCVVLGLVCMSVVVVESHSGMFRGRSYKPYQRIIIGTQGCGREFNEFMMYLCEYANAPANQLAKRSLQIGDLNSEEDNNWAWSGRTGSAPMQVGLNSGIQRLRKLTWEDCCERACTYNDLLGLCYIDQ